jgi:uncharacterized membrane protein
LNRSVQLVLEMRPASYSIRQMKVSRAFLLCLVALFITAIWGAILHFGTDMLGMPIGDGWLAVSMIVIFVLLVLALTMGAVASDASNDDELDFDAESDNGGPSGPERAE